MCQPAKFEEPTYSTLPCCTSRSMACQSSSQGVSRSTWCIWYRSMWSVCSRRSDPSQARRMLSADSLFSLGQSPIDPNTLVASTTLSRRPPPFANHRPMICSVAPSPFFHPYTLAVSKKLIPSSWARSMMACESSSDVWGPKFIVPRQSRDTLRPLRPSCAYSKIVPSREIARCERPHYHLKHLTTRKRGAGRLPAGVEDAPLERLTDRQTEIDAGEVLDTLEAPRALRVDLHNLVADDVDAHEEHPVLNQPLLQRLGDLELGLADLGLHRFPSGADVGAKVVPARHSKEPRERTVL